jgi:hypothetical protein
MDRQVTIWKESKQARGNSLPREHRWMDKSGQVKNLSEHSQTREHRQMNKSGYGKNPSV